MKNLYVRPSVEFIRFQIEETIMDGSYTLNGLNSGDQEIGGNQPGTSTGGGAIGW